MMTNFTLNPTLEADTHLIGDIGLCRLLLMNDARYPWIIMVPRRPNLSEIHDLTPLDQTVLTFEMVQISRVLKDVSGCRKINTGALGNMVSQLHVHIIARNEDDPAWPGPVWGHSPALPYDIDSAQTFADRFITALQNID